MADVLRHVRVKAGERRQPRERGDLAPGVVRQPAGARVARDGGGGAAAAAAAAVAAAARRGRGAGAGQQEPPLAGVHLSALLQDL